MLAALVKRRTSNAIDLRGRITIEVHTYSFRSTRGDSFAASVADEVAFWRSEDSPSPDVEVINAVRLGLATLPGALLVAARLAVGGCLTARYVTLPLRWGLSCGALLHSPSLKLFC